MKCPFQWDKMNGKTYTHQRFINCMGEKCPAYIPEKKINSFTVPASCVLCKMPMPHASISGQTAAALEAIGRNAHGGVVNPDFVPPPTRPKPCRR